MAKSSIIIVSVPVADQARAKAFYAEKPGFTVTMEAADAMGPGRNWITLQPAIGSLRRLMGMIMKTFSLAALALFGLAAGGALAATAPSYVAGAVADTSRPKDDLTQDALRDPADTLAFAGVRPGMMVGELFPGGGYYTRLLSDVVGPGGKIYGLENAGWNDSVKADQQLLAELGRANVVLDVEPFGQFKLPGKVDLFWITQNYHDLHIAKYGVVDMAAFNRHVFESLKPGGVYFVLDHQANPGATPAQIAALHRIEKAQVIAEVTAAGFRLVDEGKFLNRPGDDHSKTIFDPAIRGRTDQYALKFVRP